MDAEKPDVKTPEGGKVIGTEKLTEMYPDEFETMDMFMAQIKKAIPNSVRRLVCEYAINLEREDSWEHDVIEWIHQEFPLWTTRVYCINLGYTPYEIALQISAMCDRMAFVPRVRIWLYDYEIPDYDSMEEELKDNDCWEECVGECLEEFFWVYLDDNFQPHDFCHEGYGEGSIKHRTDKVTVRAQFAKKAVHRELLFGKSGLLPKRLTNPITSQE